LKDVITINIQLLSNIVDIIIYRGSLSELFHERAFDAQKDQTLISLLIQNANKNEQKKFAKINIDSENAEEI
jgi:hypothetical protein